MKNPKFSSEFTLLNKVSLREANNMTMAMFIKLLATNMDANSFFGCFNSSIIISKDFDLEPQASAEEIMAKIYEVVNGELTKVEAIGSGEIIAAREVRSV